MPELIPTAMEGHLAEWRRSRGDSVEMTAMKSENWDNDQLRVLHVPLNEYLERFKRLDNARCPVCGEDSEDVHTSLSTVQLCK